MYNMSSKETGASGGLMSSAGLTTYYDSEDQHFAIDPKTVTLFVILLAVVFIVLNVLA
jgi:preprotein translocase subunit Sec61beta